MMNKSDDSSGSSLDVGVVPALCIRSRVMSLGLQGSEHLVACKTVLYFFDSIYCSPSHYIPRLLQCILQPFFTCGSGSIHHTSMYRCQDFSLSRLKACLGLLSIPGSHHPFIDHVNVTVGESIICFGAQGEDVAFHSHLWEVTNTVWLGVLSYNIFSIHPSCFMAFTCITIYFKFCVLNYFNFISLFYLMEHDVPQDPGIVSRLQIFFVSKIY